MDFPPGLGYTGGLGWLRRLCLRKRATHDLAQLGSRGSLTIQPIPWRGANLRCLLLRFHWTPGSIFHELDLITIRTGIKNFHEQTRGGGHGNSLGHQSVLRDSLPDSLRLASSSALHALLDLSESSNKAQAGTVAS